jgi:hypothetical protein
MASWRRRYRIFKTLFSAMVTLDGCPVPSSN